MNSSKTNTLVVIVGPTAIGKTALSIALAQHFNSPIVSCDSRQFYKEMRIGTAVPNDEELNAAPHYCIQNRSIFEDYSVGQFEADALALLDTLFQKHSLVVMVGGSGLYVDAVTKGLDYFPAVDPEIRKELIKRLENEGIEKLQQELSTLDPESYQSIAIDNPHRLVRALEICKGTGKPFSSFKTNHKNKRPFTTLTIGLDADRALVYERINQRVDQMIAQGLVEEAKALHPYKTLNALQTVGYKELFEYFEGHTTLAVAIEEIKKNTRRFAKRQGTWFRKDNTIQWFDYQTPVQEILKSIEVKL